MEWWGYSKEHGWVVLDRSLPVNAPGQKANLLFFRCRDSTTIVEQRKNWNPPLYRYAPNYLRELAPAAATEAAADLTALQARWPEFQERIQREYGEHEMRAAASGTEAGQLPQKRANKSKKSAQGLAPITPAA